MESKEVFVNIINDLGNTLDSMGFYIFDYELFIDSNSSVTNLDELRKDVINNKTVLKFKTKSFISSSVWKAFSKPATEFFGIEKIPLKDLFDISDDEN
jgi:hypothetical protein